MHVGLIQVKSKTGFQNQEKKSMPAWPDGTVIANGIKIHYYRTGGDKPQVVINHGAGDDGLCWTRVATELEKEYDVILPDARGHGKSVSGKKDYSTRQRVADLVGLIKSLKLDHPAVGGHSLGADTSLHLAAEYPDLTRGIFLEDPPIVLPGETFDGGERPVKMENVGKMMGRFMLAFKLMPKIIGVPLAQKFSPTYPESEIIPWVDSKKRMSFDFINSMETAIEMGAEGAFEAFEKITVPALLFIGDKAKMSIVSQEAAQEAARVNPRVQVIHLAGASHDIRRTRFDGYMPALQKFLAELPGRIK
jgi:N-formylmaleamate deformylase